jgi:hypothetical protein
LLKNFGIGIVSAAPPPPDDESEARRTRTHSTYMPVMQTRLVVQKNRANKLRGRKEVCPKEVQSVW